MATNFQARLEELESEALKTGDRTAVIHHKRWISRMQDRLHFLDDRAPYPESLCALGCIPVDRITRTAAVVGCPVCIGDPHFPAGARSTILENFSVLRREVEELCPRQQAMNNLGVMPQVFQTTGQSESTITLERPKELGIMSKIGDIFVTAAKRGTAAGVVRGVTKRVTKVLEERYPAIAMIPDDLRNLVVCSIIHMVATGAQDKPGMSAIQQGAELALEGLVTSVVASTVEEVMNAMTTEMEALAFDTPPKSLAG